MIKKLIKYNQKLLQLFYLNNVLVRITKSIEEKSKFLSTKNLINLRYFYITTVTPVSTPPSVPLLGIPSNWAVLTEASPNSLASLLEVGVTFVP
ncbi:hypothetical protein Mgra_00003041 [Meloidogyne graminicola]|uniref:Uncharacterized protein n=1 Tax=Meloidogyne graminicola TaxID=189291 RepID=A0A8S9ZVC5_9BILA|nr:hypothetical protein Mgra_00003041 [Meloidogyne graminicola]